MSEAERNRGRAEAVAATVLVVVLSGCGGPPPYPPDLTFPTRDDRLVLRLPTAQPVGTGDPGKLDAELAGLDVLGGRTADPTAVAVVDRQALDRFLAQTFGSPAAPTLNGDAATTAAAARLGFTPDRLAAGGRLYRRHCLQCHGLAGDGRGPTGQWIYPHPRDFRRGAFKFVSTGDGGKPQATDLARTLRDGLKGTAMPSFGLLPEDQREPMAAYVSYLALRGQTEFQTLAALLTETGGEGGVDGDTAVFARDRFKALLQKWEQAEAAPAGPTGPTVPDAAGKQDPEYLTSVQRGYDLFSAKGVTDCATCHENFGRTPTYRYDLWGTVVRPADLTAGGFKGGDEPADLFRRIRGGIQPSGMPAHPGLADPQVWDLVHFVRALPYPRELPPAVRDTVYPGQ